MSSGVADVTSTVTEGEVSAMLAPLVSTCVMACLPGWRRKANEQGTAAVPVGGFGPLYARGVVAPRAAAEAVVQALERSAAGPVSAPVPRRPATPAAGLRRRSACGGPRRRGGHRPRRPARRGRRGGWGECALARGSRDAQALAGRVTLLRDDAVGVLTGGTDEQTCGAEVALAPARLRLCRRRHRPRLVPVLPARADACPPHARLRPHGGVAPRSARDDGAGAGRAARDRARRPHRHRRGFPAGTAGGRRRRGTVP